MKNTTKYSLKKIRNCRQKFEYRRKKSTLWKKQQMKTKDKFEQKKTKSVTVYKIISL